MTKTKMKLMTETLQSTKGRFFGFTTKQGGNFNAQLRSISDHYVTFFDRNKKEVRKVNKTSITSITTQGVTEVFA